MKKNYTFNISAAFFWKRLIPGLAIVVVLGILFGILVVDQIVMPNIVGVTRDIVTVPKIVGMSMEDGRESLYKSGLLTEIRSKEYDDRQPEGNIVSQSPEAGSKVKKNRKVAIVVSKGKAVGIIPDVRNLNERQARIELKKKGFTMGKTKKTYSEDKPVDIVIDAFPESGTTISRDMEVDLILSKGPKPTHAEVPNLVGESITEAKKKIADGNLVVGKITYQNNSSLLPGTIVSQSISPGSNVPFESTIDLVVSIIR